MTSSKEITIRYFRVDLKEIVFIKAILESYEGMVVVRTLEVGKDIIELLIAHDFQKIVATLIQTLQQEVKMEEVVLPPSSP